MSAGASLLVFFVVALVTLAVGLMIELIAAKFMSVAAARFGAFCFVAGSVMGRRVAVIRADSDLQVIATSLASLLAVACLGWRAFQSLRKEAH